jgi:anti-sigma B factor antagonist
MHRLSTLLHIPPLHDPADALPRPRENPVTSTTEVPTSSEPLRILLSDQLIVANRQQLKMRVIDAIAEGHVNVVLDASQCGYIDASGMGALVSMANKCRAAGGELVLEHVNDDMRVLLELTKIDTVVTVR